MANEHSYKDIWACLSKIDCRNQTEKKQGMTYLSWAWAWGILMEHYPEADWVELPPVEYADGTVAVGCMIKIGDCRRIMRLPVMDHRNKPIQNPDAWGRNKADMRCMVKALALFGLGHYIYAGEDLPVAQEPPQSAPALTSQQVAQLDALLEKCPEGTEQRVLKAFGDVASVSQLPAAKYIGICNRLRELAQ